MARKICEAVIALAVLAAVATSAAAEPVRILFIGNSLTGTNELPATVCRLAKIAGKEASCDSITRNGYSLYDHLAEGEAAKRIREGRFDIVVLQQGPSARPESRVELRQSAAAFDELIRAAGARPALYAVWPAAQHDFNFEDTNLSYAIAADDIDALLFPVGTTWLRAWQKDRNLKLYGADGFHPSPAGSYLAALVIYRGIFGGALPDKFTKPNIAQAGVSEAKLRVLRDVASAE